MKRTCLLVILVAASLGLAQAPPASQQPLTKDQVLGLVRNQLGDESGAKLIEQRGIDFEPTEDFIKSLQEANASEVFVQALRVAKRAKAEALSARLAAIMSNGASIIPGFLSVCRTLVLEVCSTWSWGQREAASELEDNSALPCCCLKSNEACCSIRVVTDQRARARRS